MVIFDTIGPVEIPTEKRNAGRRIKTDLSDFWEKHDAIASRIGCYIFSIKTGRANVPFYVGMTKRSFQAECFADHKLKHYSDTLADYVRGKPLMTFLTCDLPREKPSQAMIAKIGELETFLIQTAVRANPELRNSRGAHGPDWGIQGVLRANRGRRTSAQVMLAEMLHLSGK